MAAAAHSLSQLAAAAVPVLAQPGGRTACLERQVDAGCYVLDSLVLISNNRPQLTAHTAQQLEAACSLVLGPVEPDCRRSWLQSRQERRMRRLCSAMSAASRFIAFQSWRAACCTPTTSRRQPSFRALPSRKRCCPGWRPCPAQSNKPPQAMQVSSGSLAEDAVHAVPLVCRMAHGPAVSRPAVTDAFPHLLSTA